MRAIQITIDERLLARLDADEEVRREGRSAVLRRAAIEYLRRRRREQIAHAYRTGYAAESAVEFQDWPGEGRWPGS